MWLQKNPKKKKKISGVIVFHIPTRRVLLLRRDDGRWDLPKGHVDGEETFFEAAVRECWEETGLKANEDLDIFPYTYISLPSKSWLRFYLGFTKENYISVSHEHTGYYWATLDDIKNLLKKNNHFRQLITAMYNLAFFDML